MAILHNILIFTFLFLQTLSSPKEDYKCGLPGQNLKVGDLVILCIHILKENKKLAMPIKVDEYSMISFNHIFEIYDTLNNKKEIEFIAQIGDATTVNPIVR